MACTCTTRKLTQSHLNSMTTIADFQLYCQWYVLLLLLAIFLLGVIKLCWNHLFHCCPMKTVGTQMAQKKLKKIQTLKWLSNYIAIKQTELFRILLLLVSNVKEDVLMHFIKESKICKYDMLQIEFLLVTLCYIIYTFIY